MKKFLVTGASGFLGTHLVERLKTQAQHDPDGLSVRVLSRKKTRWEGDPKLEIVCGDILDPQAVDRAVAGVSGIFHLAGSVTRDPAQAAGLFDTHIRGTRNLCESARAHGSPRMIIASSSGTLAVSRKPILHTEDSPYSYEITGHWPYYLSKICQEKLALSYHAHHSLPVIVMNPSLLLGPGDEKNSSSGDIQMFLDGFASNIPNGGMNFVDVRDAADAFIRAMQLGVPGRRYLLGGHNMTVHEFFQLIERVTGVRGPRVRLPENWARRGAAILRRIYGWLGRSFPIDDCTVEMAYRFWYIDNTRAHSELRFTPRPAEDTIRDTVEFLRSRKSPAPGKQP
ncbi:MAG: NAD-dependent epimerase/dehydratase family protein [Acidobacteria bacterium]|nr:NAD-dependent epimerase/dehydratase family protein [Acidobacteriota bacterium]